MNIPTNARPSTRILKDLLKVRKELIKVENSNQPFVSKIDPLIKKDYFLSDALVRYLCYEMNIVINLKLEEEEENVEDLFWINHQPAFYEWLWL